MLTAVAITSTERSVVPYAEVKYLLWNWKRWAATHMPDLGVQPPPWAEYFRAYLAWDSGWGDYEATPEALPPKIDERAAEKMDKDLMGLAISHLKVIKNHYLNDKPQRREVLDAAVRALGDIL